MRRIFKSVVPIHGQTCISVPSYGRLEILHVALQDGVPTVWYYCNPGMMNHQITLEWFGTGHDIPDNAWYIDTIHQNGFVWHLHEVRYC